MRDYNRKNLDAIPGGHFIRKTRHKFAFSQYIGPTLIHAHPVLQPCTADTSADKLQAKQIAILRIATGCPRLEIIFIWELLLLLLE